MCVCLWAKWSTRWQSFPYKKGLESQNEFNTAGSFWAAATGEVYRLKYSDWRVHGTVPTNWFLLTLYLCFKMFPPLLLLLHHSFPTRFYSIAGGIVFYSCDLAPIHRREDFERVVLVVHFRNSLVLQSYSVRLRVLNGTRIFQHPTQNHFCIWEAFLERNFLKSESDSVPGNKTRGMLGVSGW